MSIGATTSIFDAVSVFIITLREFLKDGIIQRSLIFPVVVALEFFLHVSDWWNYMQPVRLLKVPTPTVLAY